MSRQDVIQQKREALERQKELLRVQKKKQGRARGLGTTIAHTESVIRGLERQIQDLENFKPETRAEWLHKAISRIDNLPNSWSAYNKKLRAQYQAELDALK